MPDPIQLQFEFPDDAGPLSERFNTLGTISSQMRDDWQTISDSMQSTLDKAVDMRSKIVEPLNEMLTGMKSVVDLVSQGIKDNATGAKEVLATINTILQSSNSINAVMNRTGQNGPGAASQGFSNPLANPMAWGAYANQMHNYSSDPFWSASSRESQFADPNHPDFFESRARIIPTEEELGGTAASTSRKKSSVPVEEPYEEDQIPHASGRLADEAQYDTARASYRPQSAIPLNISELYPNLANAGYFDNLNNYNYQHAPSMAISGLTQTMQDSAIGQLLGMIPGANTIIPGMSNIAQSYAKWASAGQQYQAPAPGEEVGPAPAGNFYTQAQQALMSKLDSLVGSLDRFTQSSTAVNAAGIMSTSMVAYNQFKVANNAIRSDISYPMQALGDITGTVSPTQFASYKAQALGYNIPEKALYSTTDAYTAMLAAQQLGYRGPGEVTNYENLDYQLQTGYGLSHGETQQLMSSALAYGLDLNQYTTGYEQARKLGASTDTNMAYVSQNYQLGAGTAASLGFRGSAATAFGNAAVGFGAGNFVAQAAGMTGQELMGTPLGIALFAQQAGTSFMDSYSAAQNMGAAQATKLQSQAMMQLLQQIGIPVNTISKPSDLNPYAIKLSLILPQLGVTDVTTPQQAVVWAYSIIAQARNLPNTTSMLSSYTQPTTASGTATQGVPSTSTFLNSLTTDTSALGIAAMNNGLNVAGTSSSTSATTSNGVTVQVALAPGLQNILTAAVQSANASVTSPSARVNQTTTS